MVPFINIHTHRKPTTDELIIRNAWLPSNITQKLPEGYYTSVGLHPWHAEKLPMAHIGERMENLLRVPHVKAIGEIGLDRINGAEFPVQQTVFELQLDMAKKYNRPVIIHCVRAYSDILSYIKHSNIPFILHHYQGNEQTTLQLLRFDNVYFSFGKLIYKHEKTAQGLLKQIPLHRIFLETDTLKVEINEVYRKVADLRNVELEELKENLFGNFRACFDPINQTN